MVFSDNGTWWIFSTFRPAQEEEQWEQRIETFVQPARKMSAEISDKMKLKLASFEAEAARTGGAERSGPAPTAPARTIQPDNSFRDKLKVFKSIETEAASAPATITAIRRDSESAPPPVRRDSDSAWLQRSAGRAENSSGGGKRDAAATVMTNVSASSGVVLPTPQPAAVSSFQQSLRRVSEPTAAASPERLRELPASYRSSAASSSSSALMNTIQNNKFFQQVADDS
jgi:hypothetical protein